MNYNDPTSVLKDFHWGVFRPGIVNMKVEEGDAILLTAKELNERSSRSQGSVDYACAMIGTVKAVDVTSDLYDVVGVQLAPHQYAVTGPTHLVDWKASPIEISPDFSCVQGGYICIDDRAEILSQLALV
jgi:hypothetical protein